MADKASVLLPLRVLAFMVRWAKVTKGGRMPHQPFKDNVVILTGASRGIGEQLAYQLAAQGARLALAARHAETLEVVAAACRERGGQAIAVPADLTNEALCHQLIARTLAEYARVDTLINNPR